MSNLTDNPFYYIIYNQNLKRDVLSHYGELKCFKCGYNDNLDALELHHLYHNGAQHRKVLGVASGTQFLIRLRQMNYPNDPKYPLVVCCSNCNSILYSQFKRKFKSNKKPIKITEKE